MQHLFHIEMKIMKKRFALCIDNKGYEASLIPRKFYEVIPDEQDQQDDFVRVIDESGEDYLYMRAILFSLSFQKKSSRF